jgi:hypothetical protein
MIQLDEKRHMAEDFYFIQRIFIFTQPRVRTPKLKALALAPLSTQHPAFGPATEQMPFTQPPPQPLGKTTCACGAHEGRARVFLGGALRAALAGR